MICEQLYDLALGYKPLEPEAMTRLYKEVMK